MKIRNMFPAFFSFSLALLVSTATGITASGDPLDIEIDIPYEKFVLPNGLTLLVHEDHKAPIVAVNVWYHVGSKNEKVGKTGFAHLFEHLMFNGSEHHDDDYFKPLEPAGATDFNGTTNEDRTNYFQNVPTNALDLALWMESDRMGYMKGAISQERLDEQRGVVQNEKRQYENQPYGKTYELITENTYPAGHPYSWTVIGSLDDLNAAALEDVHEWFGEYYGAANAVLSIAGDVDTAEIKALVEKYFGEIPSGPPLSRHEAWIAKRSGTQRQVTWDRVPQARIYKVWNIPQWGTAEADYLNLLSDVLALGKTSRLYKRLVYEEQIATDVSSYVDLREIAGQFYIEATAKPGEDLDKIERIIDEELAELLKKGPDKTEMQRVKTSYVASFVRGIERIGGFGGKSDILAQNQVYGGDPSFYKTTLQRVKDATAKDLKDAANAWLTDGVYILEVYPFPEYAASEEGADRSALPQPGEPPVAAFPDFKRTELSNGLKLIVANRPSVPVVQFSLLVDAGYAADQFAAPGVANMAMNMLDEGTEKLDSLEISEKLALLGASLATGSNLDQCVVEFSTLKSTLDDSLDIFADVVLNPAFPQNEFDRLQKEQLARIQREKVTPVQMALRVFPKFLYGDGHAYSNPMTGSGNEASVSGMTVDDLKKFHGTWFRPNNATLIVVGDTTVDEIAPKIENAFSDWEQGDTPEKNVAHVDHKDEPVVYLINRPGSIQSIIFAGHVAPPQANPDEFAIEVMNYPLGDAFTSRINMNLREDKHWSYGARSMFFSARGQRPFLVYTSVQSDKTSESMVEIQKELDDVRGERPLTDDELAQSKNSLTLTLPGNWETMGSVGDDLANIVRYGLPDDYYATYASEIRSVSSGDASNAAEKVIQPAKLVWVIVGDRAQVEEGIKALGWGEIRHIDADGNPVN